MINYISILNFLSYWVKEVLWHLSLNKKLQFFEMESSGDHIEMKFDVSTLSSGIYFYRLDSGSYSAVHKIMLIK